MLAVKFTALMASAPAVCELLLLHSHPSCPFLGPDMVQGDNQGLFLLNESF